MQSLQPEPAARYRNVADALWRIVRTEGRLEAHARAERHGDGGGAGPRALFRLLREIEEGAGRRPPPGSKQPFGEWYCSPLPSLLLLSTLCVRLSLSHTCIHACTHTRIK